MTTTTIQHLRTWDAVIQIDGMEFEASAPRWDLLKECVATAAREAALLAPEATIVVYKTTKAHGRKRDRSLYTWTTGQGAVRTQDLGA